MATPISGAAPTPPCAVVPLRCEYHSHVKCQMMIRAVPYTHTTPTTLTQQYLASPILPTLVVSNTSKIDTLPTGLLVHTYIVPTPHGGNWAVCKNRGWPVGPRYPSSCFRFHRTLHAFGQMTALPWSMYSSWIGSGAREGALLGFPQYGVCFQRRCAWERLDIVRRC